MRTAAQAEMVLDESSEPEVVISYLSDLLQRAQAEQTEQERIVYHQSFLNIPKMVNDDLALAKDEVSYLDSVQLLCLTAWRDVILGVLHPLQIAGLDHCLLAMQAMTW